jgi:hypothetical protein
MVTRYYLSIQFLWEQTLPYKMSNPLKLILSWTELWSGSCHTNEHVIQVLVFWRPSRCTSPSYSVFYYYMYLWLFCMFPWIMMKCLVCYGSMMSDWIAVWYVSGNINQSLLTLGRVITALVEHAPHVPYRYVTCLLTLYCKQFYLYLFRASLLPVSGKSFEWLEIVMSLKSMAYVA